MFFVFFLEVKTGLVSQDLVAKAYYSVFTLLRHFTTLAELFNAILTTAFDSLWPRADDILLGL